MNFTENNILDTQAQTQTVAELVRAAQAGDKDAFGQLFERYRAGIVAQAMRRVRNADEAEELANQNIELFSKIISKETPLIGIEPSAILTFRDEYPRLAKTKSKLKS